MVAMLPAATRRADGSRRIVLLGLAVASLAGCKDEKKSAAMPSTVAASMQRAMDAAEQAIQSAAPAPAKVRFRGVQVWSQATPQRVAVCGQVSPFADDANIFVPFVSVVTAQQNGQPTQYQFDQFVGTTTDEASRVYAAIVNYCYENGGPVQSSLRTATPTPPLPDAVPNPALKPSASTPAASAQQGAKPPIEASGTVVVRQSANVHSDPKGPSIRTVQQGASLHIFGQAPGGWYQVGDTAPFGWVHESMLDKR